VNESLLGFLELVQRELGGVDARAEFGGQEPSDPKVVWHSPEPGFRIIVLFEAAPQDPEMAVRRLTTLTDTFLHSSDLPRAGRDAARATELHLDDALRELSERAGAVAAVVVDETSPVLWGSSLPREGAPSVDALVFAAAHPDLSASDGARVTGRALAAVRANPKEHLVQKPGFGFVSRPFATIYHLVLSFAGPLSELQADGAMVRALPHIERLVLALPPVDPPTPGGRVLRLPRPSR
jgi:hypothetical protein